MTTTTMTGAPAAPSAAKPWYKVLYVQVLIAIVLGAIVGWLWPTIATNDWIKALGDGFIKLIKMVIAPIIFCTVVSGIAHIQDAKKVGRIGVKALVYFEVVSTFALVIGLIIGNVVEAGRGLRQCGGQCECRCQLCQAGGSAEVGRLHPAHHSRHRGRRLRARRDPAGAAVLGAVRLRRHGARRARSCDPQLHRRRRACRVRRHLDRDARRAARRVRRDGLHHRQVRHRRDPQSDGPDRDVLPDRRAVRLRRARHSSRASPASRSSSSWPTSRTSC